MSGTGGWRGVEIASIHQRLLFSSDSPMERIVILVVTLNQVYKSRRATTLNFDLEKRQDEVLGGAIMGVNILHSKYCCYKKLGHFDETFNRKTKTEP